MRVFSQKTCYFTYLVEGHDRDTQYIACDYLLEMYNFHIGIRNMQYSFECVGMMYSYCVFLLVSSYNKHTLYTYMLCLYIIYIV